MQMHVELAFTIALTDRELRLVGLALAGKIRHGSSDEKAALELNTRLQEQRHRTLADTLALSATAAERAKELEAPPEK